MVPAQHDTRVAPGPGPCTTTAWRDVHTQSMITVSGTWILYMGLDEHALPRARLAAWDGKTVA